jgi:hypothetical protein
MQSSFLRPPSPSSHSVLCICISSLVISGSGILLSSSSGVVPTASPITVVASCIDSSVTSSPSISLGISISLILWSFSLSNATNASAISFRSWSSILSYQILYSINARIPFATFAPTGKPDIVLSSRCCLGHQTLSYIEDLRSYE